jgi:Ca2+:H+ antiporter
MKQILESIKQRPLSLLLVALPMAILAAIMHWGEEWVFILSAVAIIPFAQLIGEATEALADYTGPRIGGLLNATLGNAAELIITIMAIREGLLELVKASIAGSILGNLLLVMGLAMVFGGVKYGIQSFDRRQASRNAILLILAVMALVIPSLFSDYIGAETSLRVESLSIGIAVIMLVIYSLALIFSLKIDAKPAKTDHTGDEIHLPTWSVRKSLLLLALATLGVVVASELLVGAVEPVVVSLGISEFFVGIILIPIIGNVAEHLVAVKVAMQNKMDLSVEITVASSLQIALFVAPVLVFISLFMGNPMKLIFNELELIALIVGVVVAALVSEDGESNWLEGSELLAVYIIIALAFFLIPG